MDKDTLLPSQFLVENISLLPKGEALDIAMGNGRNTIYLAKMGYMSEGVDISAESINNALINASKADVDIKAAVADLEDKYEIKKESYDVIVCFNYLHRSLMPQIKAGLRKGGIVMYETYITDQAVLFGKPSNPDYLLKHNELLELFNDLRCLRYREGVINKRAIASIVSLKE